jgi:hypothetical protein
MSEQYRDQPSRPADVVRQEGSAVVGETQRDAEQVVRHAGDEAGEVLDTARREVRDVVDEAVHAVNREADERTRQAGRALHGMSEDLHRMARADGADHSAASDYVDAIANTIDRVAERMEAGGSSGIVDSLRSTADRRPGSFITGSMMAGFVVGRMLRAGDGRAVVQSAADRAPSSAEPAGEIDLRDDERSATEPVYQDAYGMPDPELATAGVRRHTGPLPPPPPGPPQGRQEPF